MLRIKSNINSEVLTEKYGFIKKVLYDNKNICEFYLKEKHCMTLIQRGDRSIYSVIPGDWDTDCTPISDVVYRLIIDGLVECVKD